MIRRPSFLAVVGMSAIVVALSGCPSENESAKPPQSPANESPAVKAPAKPAAKPKSDERAESHAKAEPVEEQVAQDVEQVDPV